MNGMNMDEILEPVGPAEETRRERRVRRKFWTTFQRAASRLPFAEEVVAGYYCALDSRTPRRTRAILFAALAYFVMPFDIIPDILLGIGFTDDIAVLTAALTAVSAQIKPSHRDAARQALKDMRGGGAAKAEAKAQAKT